MKCPECEEKDMVPAFTEQGVEIDYCPDCKGIWLDKGEIYYFTKKPAHIQKELDEAIKKGKPSERICPRTGKNMLEVELLEGKLSLEYSPSSGGIWFDAAELEKIVTHFGDKIYLKLDRGTAPSEEEAPSRPIPLPPLPNLLFRSTMVLVSLYGLLTLILITLTIYTDLTPGAALIIGVAIATFQFLLGPFLTDFSLRWFYKMSWIEYAELPVFLKDFITETCRRHNMKDPRMGLIHDGAPNAFTYGHTPNNARIVLTQGLLDLLNEEEIKGVAAHEIGHAKHWDMLIMTAAQLVPLILYYIYRTLISMRGDGEDKTAGPRLAIAIGSYVLYIVSQYVVLWLSRTREYFADRFAGEQTKDPNCLARGLVKIGYGLAGKSSVEKGEKEEEREPGLEAVGALGIFDSKSAAAMAVSSISSVSAAKRMGGEIDEENLKGAMRWDLWNPWAKYYELHSTHPLIAKRINHLSKQSEALGKSPYIRFDERKPESYWDEFFVDVFIRILPTAAFIAFLAVFFLTHNTLWIGAAIFGAGLASFWKTRVTYRSDFFPEMSVSSLLKKVKVSGIRPVPCRVYGTIIGRGIPGLIWSEDFVMQDETGIMFLDYRQPIPLWDFFFGLLRRARYQDQEAEITGWYRRSPVPYVELKAIKAKGEAERKCYTYIAKYVGAGILAALGLLMMLSYQATVPHAERSYTEIQRSLPSDQLEYFSDSFDTFNDHLWAKVPPLLPKNVKDEDFLPADMTNENGELRFTTKSDHLSKTVIASKFRLSGDFDIQIDCDIDFMGESLGTDHYLFFVNLHDGKKPARRTTIGFSFLKRGENNPGVLRSAWWSKRQCRGQKTRELESFQGSVRFVRVGSKITTLFKEYEALEWQEMARFSCPMEACRMAMGLQNFIGPESLTLARSSLSAGVDNFRINAAERIVK